MPKMSNGTSTILELPSLSAFFDCFFRLFFSTLHVVQVEIYSLRTVRKQCTSYSQLLGYF